MTLNRFGNSSLGSVEKRPRKLNILQQRESFITKLNRCNYLGPKKKKNLVSKTNLLLVQTIYFVNQERTEAITTELLVDLNYIRKKLYIRKNLY